MSGGGIRGGDESGLNLERRSDKMHKVELFQVGLVLS